MDLTVLGIDLPETRIGAPFSAGTAPGETGAGADTGAPGDGDGIRPLVVLAVVAGLALLARYLRRSGSTGDEPPSA